MTQRRYEINDEQWEQIKDMFPPYQTGRPSKLNNRTMFNAILWIASSGAAWRDLPEERFGSWKTVYSRFCKWRNAGLLVDIFQALQVEPDFENLSIDSTSVKAHQHSAGAKKNAEGHEVNQHIGVSRGGKTTKLHTVVDGLGNPLAFLLTGGQVFDSVPAIDLLQEFDLTGSHIIGDKAYGSEAFRKWVTSKQASYTIPPKANRKQPWKVDWYRYKERHLVECFFNKIKHFRRVATRYDKLATSFLAFVYVAAIFKLTQ
ncbi:IS5 family transposase [Bacillaceae bacterium SIJ1]|uniref:IS5 family transposase n=1 Tax=Litoribacterium kuwaitense TaxID=1398745 RepID=UPI0013EBD0A8|nr:IS5 family transposase [Litoribacterium kuwaitense]NGP46934.1 IS5 family transposase [Litoribacterium kuwaitense]